MKIVANLCHGANPINRDRTGVGVIEALVLRQRFDCERVCVAHRSYGRGAKGCGRYNDAAGHEVSRCARVIVNASGVNGKSNSLRHVKYPKIHGILSQLLNESSQST